MLCHAFDVSISHSSQRRGKFPRGVGQIRLRATDNNTPCLARLVLASFAMKSASHSIHSTLAFSLTALILYIPANLFPFMTIELYGNRNSSTIWTGVVALAESGSVAIALVVFLASIVIPFIKLALLFYLALSAKQKKHPNFKNRLYQIIEAIGRWSMLDIFLLAVLVAIMKLGPWTTVEPGLGALLFALVVIFTMLASASFDPQLLLKDENEESKIKS